MSLVTVTRSYTRSASTTAWYVLAPTMLSHQSNNYTKTNLLVSRTESLSTDKLTLSVITVWKDMNAYESWLADPIVIEFHVDRTAYNVANNITESTPVVTT